MTVSEAIARTDALEPNQYTEQQKTTWLDRLDGQIFNEVILTHEHEEGAQYTPLSSGTDELLVPSPYDEIYNYWLQAKIAMENSEGSKYTMNMELFNAAYLNYCHWYNRMNRPIGFENRMFF